MRCFLSSLLLCLGLVACGGLKVEKVPLGNAPYPSETAQPSPIGFNKIRLAVPTGTPTISRSPRGVMGLINCDYPYGTTETGMRGRGFPSDEWREIFLNTMEGLGYDVTGNPGRLFDEEEDLQRTVYSIGGRITDVKIDTCPVSNIWGISRGHKGEASMTVEWSVFDLLTRRTVYKVTTKGYGRLDNANYQGLQLLFEDALASAIHNLGSDEPFYELVFYGTPLENAPKSYDDAYEQPVGLYDPQEEVVISASAKGFASEDDIIRRAAKSAVLIQTTGHGSGFFISAQGHILTNAHVVGNAGRVRVVTSGKEHKIVAEVLRIDRKRDVALLRLEEVPEDLEIQVLPVKLEMPEVGDSVYAIGAPIYTRLQDTVTKGIISGKRYNRKLQHWELQADVETYKGNSGGPLLDEDGNIIGLSVAGYQNRSAALSGLNLFIPIEDALEELHISIVP